MCLRADSPLCFAILSPFLGRVALSLISVWLTLRHPDRVIRAARFLAGQAPAVAAPAPGAGRSERTVAGSMAGTPAAAHPGLSDRTAEVTRIM
jgi:hypothetical protein